MGPQDYTWSISVNGFRMASGEATSKSQAISEAMHYASQYLEELTLSFYLQIRRK